MKANRAGPAIDLLVVSWFPLERLCELVSPLKNPKQTDHQLFVYLKLLSASIVLLQAMTLDDRRPSHKHRSDNVTSVTTDVIAKHLGCSWRWRIGETFVYIGKYDWRCLQKIWFLWNPTLAFYVCVYIFGFTWSNCTLIQICTGSSCMLKRAVLCLSHISHHFDAAKQTEWLNCKLISWKCAVWMQTAEKLSSTPPTHRRSVNSRLNHTQNTRTRRCRLPGAMLFPVDVAKSGYFTHIYKLKKCKTELQSVQCYK